MGANDRFANSSGFSSYDKIYKKRVMPETSHTLFYQP